MTTEQMKEEHRQMIIRGRLSKYHAALSIEYAISVLEDIATTTATIEGAYIKMNEKIQQLRKLITV